MTEWSCEYEVTVVMELKQVLQEARRRKGLTQQQVADMLDVTLRTYQRYESGTRRMSLETAVLLSEILGVDVRDLAQRQSRSA
ncbi:helix-turn-helix transcriptional regulator [Alicyclobacillus mali (ex Roth et al. 2021)]|nr:helix-turn-helix transcriptional regulator [Alicyclobacillus mali (ex Roth et al. 2021)]